MNRDYYTSPGSVPNDIDSRKDLKSIWCCFDKGYTPPPFKLVHDVSQGLVEVQFEQTDFTTTCQCNIECTTDALVFEDLTKLGRFCPADKQFKVTLLDQAFSESAPTEFSFFFEDSKGNETSIKVSTLITVVPKAPMAIVKEDFGRFTAEIGIPLYSAGFVDLRKVVDQYQIERYEGSPNNRTILVDWTHTRAYGPKERVHWDRRLRDGVEYGYRVRFRSSFDDASPWSSWTVVEP